MTGVDRLLDAIREIGVIRPGDRLLLTTDMRLTHEQAHEIKSRAEALMPDVTVVLLSGFTATIQRAEP